MLTKYLIVHGPTGLATVAQGYTPEQAHRAGMLELNKYVNAPGVLGKAPAHGGNTTVLAATGEAVTSKVSSGAAPALPPVVTLTPGHDVPAGFTAPGKTTVKKSGK